ncbi:MAG: histidine kinase dimerization/phospho-acceptor domain-containing protein [Patescibacteria group bacterium]
MIFFEKQQRKNFIHKIAHDLRTPLSVIKINSEIALCNNALDDNTKQKLSTIIDEVNKMSDSIKKLLDAEE